MLILVPRLADVSSSCRLGTVDLVNEQVGRDAGQTAHLSAISTAVGLIIPFGFLAVPLFTGCIGAAFALSPWPRCVSSFTGRIPCALHRPLLDTHPKRTVLGVLVSYAFFSVGHTTAQWSH